MLSENLRTLATQIRTAAERQDAACMEKCAHVVKAAKALNLLQKKVTTNVR